MRLEFECDTGGGWCWEQQNNTWNLENDRRHAQWELRYVRGENLDSARERKGGSTVLISVCRTAQIERALGPTVTEASAVVPCGKGSLSGKTEGQVRGSGRMATDGGVEGSLRSVRI